MTFKLSIEECKLQGGKLISCKHFFISAIKNKDSQLYEYIQDENPLEILLKYYEQIEKIAKEAFLIGFPIFNQYLYLQISS